MFDMYVKHMCTDFWTFTEHKSPLFKGTHAVHLSLEWQPSRTPSAYPQLKWNSPSTWLHVAISEHAGFCTHTHTHTDTHRVFINTRMPPLLAALQACTGVSQWVLAWAKYHSHHIHISVRRDRPCTLCVAGCNWYLCQCCCTGSACQPTSQPTSQPSSRDHSPSSLVQSSPPTSQTQCSHSTHCLWRQPDQEFEINTWPQHNCSQHFAVGANDRVG